MVSICFSQALFSLRQPTNKKRKKKKEKTQRSLTLSGFPRKTSRLLYFTGGAHLLLDIIGENQILHVLRGSFSKKR
jgi:predicted HAD superfamily Cof-like phosphohydrolase